MHILDRVGFNLVYDTNAMSGLGLPKTYNDDAAGFGQWRIDPTTRRVSWSDGLARVFGRAMPADRTVSFADHFDCYHPEDREYVLARVERILAGGFSTTYQRRARIIRPDGTVRDVIIQGVPELDTDARLTALHGMLLDVTELVQFEQHAYDAGQLLHVTLESMDQGLVVLDAGMCVSAFNKSAAELLDLPPEILHLGASFEAIHDFHRVRGDFSTVAPELRLGMLSGDLQRLPLVYDWLKPSGITLELRRSPLKNGGWVVTFSDVTQHRSAQRAVVESEHRYRLLAENATDITIWSDLSTCRRYVSPAVTTILGYAPEELIGTKPLDFVHPEDSSAYRLVLDDLTRGRVERALTSQRYKHRDGRWIWLEISFNLTHDATTGDPDGYVATLRDISERKVMEAALSESEARYRTLVEAQLHEAQARADFTAATSAAILAQLAEGVIVTDAAGRITLVNAAAAAIHGVARLDIEPDSYSDTYHLFTEDGLPHPPRDLPLARAVRGETVCDARWRIVRPDGSEVVAVGSAQPLRGPHQEQIGAVLTLRDNTAKEIAVRALRDLNATLSQRVDERTSEAEAARSLAEAGSKAKSDFLASMSHEIRTPLHGVLGYADLLGEEHGLSVSARQHVERIRSAGAALLTVVNDVLDFSKIEAGQIELSNEPFALEALIDNAVSIVRGSAERKGLGFSIEMQTAVPAWIVGDQDRLRQVLLNLLNNAVKFTAVGFISLSISARREAGGAVRLRFSVHDTGIGIPAEKLGRLFQRFSQVDGSISRDYGGTGLGLAITKSLIELMGGAVGVESIKGCGSTFWFEVELPTVTQPVISASPIAADVVHVGMHLLLAEDVLLNQELACAILKHAGHEVDIVANGIEAIAAVAARTYDLVLMDVQMPGMDGMTATRHIRTMEGANGNMPIIAMTANVLPHQIAEFIAAGMNDHVGKPFKRSGLLEVIERWAPRHSAPKVRTPTIDRETFEELSDTVGDLKAQELLDLLADELNQRLIANAFSSDREKLARDAHAMISATSMLGFIELSDLCRKLEDACNTQRDLDDLIHEVRLSTKRTLDEIDLMCFSKNA
ncbi:PAS domain S-box protein [Methylobacterium sp. W2]|uniref:PAS domain S-box protein n=1 Tax=Methylobacterium sp. W2 TaxID=2598107 RepID=UPI001D0BFD57|nr:PAS domain S-box protein [Methylobacterium sp. W2]MCC0809020.1 PAS domain S-box protein [Methylobacterium sp. W2]